MQKILYLFVALLMLGSCADEEPDKIEDPEFTIVHLTASGGFAIVVLVRLDNKGSIELNEVGAYANSEIGNPGIEFENILLSIDGTFKVYQGSVYVDRPGTYYVRPYVKDANGKIYEGEEVEINTGAVTVEDFNPKLGGVGSVINVTGTNFSNGIISPEVLIGEVKAEILNFTTNSITAKVPLGIAVSPVKVVVKTLAGEFTVPGELEWVKGVWTKMPDYEGSYFSLSQNPLSFTLDESAYIGINGGDNKIWKFNTTTEVWSESNTYPGNGDYGHGLQFQNGIPAYITQFNDEWWYVSATNSWIQRPPFPAPSTGIVVFSFTNGSESFIGKYYDSGSKLGVWKKQSTDAIWTQLSDCPASMRSELALTIEGKTYLIGGAYVASNKAWSYDPILDEWTQIADGPFEARKNAVGFVIENKIYFGGGAKDNNDPLADFYEFTPSTGEWIRIQDIPEINGYPRLGSFIVNNKGYVIRSKLFYRFEIE